MSAIKFRAHFGYDADKASQDTAIFCKDPSLTVQDMAEDADINVLMHRYGITGKMPENPRVPMYGDFTGVKDYKSALDAIMNAQDSFMELPAKVRARFNNNPQELLEFCADDANIKEAQDLGLLKKDVSHGSVSRNRGEGEGSAASSGPGSSVGGASATGSTSVGAAAAGSGGNA